MMYAGTMSTHYYLLAAGQPTLPKWPDEIARKYDAHWYGMSFGFLPASEAEQNFLSDCSRHDLALRKVEVPRWEPKNIDRVPYYFLGVKDSTPGFSAVECYEDIFSCDNLPPDFIVGMSGCAEGKLQTRKWRIIKPSRAKKADIFHTSLVDGPRLPPDENLIVTRRLRDLLIREKLTGFRLTPVLDGGRSWSAKELAVDFIDDSQIAEAKWFQLTITGRAREAIQLQAPLTPHPRSTLQTCSFCDRNLGTVSESLNWHRFPPTTLADVDLQLCDTVLTVEGVRLRCASALALIASSKFVRLVVEEKITGFFRAAKVPKVDFWPVLFEVQ